jgi:phage-related protein (TIGR01555 family)
VDTNADNFRKDGALVNVLSGMGLTTKDKTVATSVGAKAILSEGELEALYAHGIPRRYVDAISDEILRHRTTIKLGGDEQSNANDLIADFEEYLKATQFHHAFAEVVKLQRLYGGAGLVLLIDDGLPPEEPVDPARIRAVRGYVPLSRWELIPEDFSITDYTKPSHYRITTAQRLTPEQQGQYVNVRIHSSRVARFDGLYLPWNVRVRNTGWGLPVLQLVWEAYKRYETALSGLESMTTDSDLFVHKIPGLFNRIASGNESDLRKRLEANNLSRSVYGGMVVDTEEELSFLNRALSNIASATDPFIKDLQAATGWPASILMGDSPGGLGKEGRFEERVWATLVEQWQELYCRTAVTEVFTYILASREGPTRGRPPQKWSVEFPSIFTETDSEKAALRLQIAQVDAQYLNLGVLNALEVREARFGGTEYSIETTLNGAVTEQLIAQADASFQSQMMGYQAQAEAMTNPPEAEGAQPEEEEQEEESTEEPQPDKTAKTDSVEIIHAHGYHIKETHRKDSVSIGYLVAPDGQRVDAADNAALFVVGPQRAHGRKLYRARFDHQGQLIEGPYAIGFRTLHSAKRAISAFYPRQNVAGLSPVSEGEAEALRAGWEQY